MELSAALSLQNKSTVMCCRIRGLHSASPRPEKRVKHSPDDGTQSENVSFSVVASMDASTMPLVMLQSKRVYLAVSDVPRHVCDSTRSAVNIGKVNCSHDDISFEQLMIQLGQRQRMLVSTVAILNSLC